MASITQFEYVIAVDRFRHFKKAAAFCHVSQPTLSAQLQKLEEELELVIFDRSKKPILPTEQGKLIINQAKSVIREYQKLIDISQTKKGQLTGTFYLGVIPTLAPYLIPLFLKDFSQNFPQVELVIEEYKTQDIIQLLAQDRLDGAILVTPLKEDQLIEKTLFYEPFSLYISPDHPLNQQKRITETELNNVDMWLLEDGHCFKNQTLKICHTEALSNHPLPNIKFSSGNLETLKKLVRDQGGYTLLPYLATIDLEAKNQSQYLRQFQSPYPSREVSLVYSRSFLKEDIINALETCILKNIPQKLISYKKQSLQVIPIL